MELFDKLSSQIACIGLPLFAVSMTAVPRANTPVMLMLHWHGFRKDPERRRGAHGAKAFPAPGSALQINESWQSVAALDHAMLEVAWQLGAWELEREEKRPCNTVGASETEAFECQRAFASHPMQTEDDWVTEAPDLNDLMHFGAKVGYVRWLFRPVRAGIWGQHTHDETLDGDGGREPPCPVAPRDMAGPNVSTRYRLGRSTQIVLL